MFLPYKDDNPSRSFPFVTVSFILISVGVFIIESNAVIARYSFIPRNLLHPSQWIHTGKTLVTSVFLHGDAFHLSFNMLFLWIFGDNVEDRIGHFRYAVLFLFFGAVAALCQAVIGLFPGVNVLGASGAVAGVMGAYFVLFPRAKVRTLVFVFPMILPAAIFLGVWFVTQVWSSIVGRAGVAWYAHIGGFIAGYVIAKRYLRKRQAKLFGF